VSGAAPRFASETGAVSRIQSETGAAPRTATAPGISVAVPTYRRHDALTRCLEALARQTIAKHEFEVIVVDDGNVAAAGCLCARRLP